LSIRSRDPLEDTPTLIRRVYSYVAYLIGDGPDAEDVTSAVFERAFRYRESYDPARGTPLTWLFGITRHCVDDAARDRRRRTVFEQSEPVSNEDIEATAIQKLTVAAAIERLDERARNLLALRYGADLSARQIGAVLGMKTNAVEVALHRALSRLRADIEGPTEEEDFHVVDSAPQSSS
jgi:RNA polymerase sigma factor (sigma-70 family)